MKLLFIDTETTGLDCQHDRVIQVAARLILDNQTLDYCSYIQPSGFEVPESAFQIHGISAEFAEQNGLPLSEVLDTLDVIISLADAIVGHHIEFDVKFLVAEARRAGREDLATAILETRHICTKKMSAQYLERVGEKSTRSTTKLGTMFLRFTQEPLEGAHDAFTDVLACQRVHKELVAA